MSVEQILADREVTHGDFTQNAAISQMLKDAMRSCPGWNGLHSYEKEALDMIAAKAARILSGGNSHFPDHWQDLAGYATLAAEQNHQLVIEEEQRPHIIGLP